MFSGSRPWYQKESSTSFSCRTSFSQPDEMSTGETIRQSVFVTSRTATLSGCLRTWFRNDMMHMAMVRHSRSGSCLFTWTYQDNIQKRLLGTHSKSTADSAAYILGSRRRLILGNPYTSMLGSLQRWTGWTSTTLPERRMPLCCQPYGRQAGDGTRLLPASLPTCNDPGRRPRETTSAAKSPR